MQNLSHPRSHVWRGRWNERDFNLGTEKAICGANVELQQLHDLLKIVVDSGQPKFVMIQGDFGVGKTALVKRFLAESLEKNPALMLGQAACERETESNGLVPFSQLFVSLLKISIQREVVSASPSEFVSETAPAWLDILGMEVAEKDFEVAHKPPEYEEAVSDHALDSTTIRNRSGGVNVAAESIQVNGDVVGRDKIVANVTNIYADGHQLRGGRTYTPDQVFVQYLNALHKLLGNLPVIAFVDDLQWADTSSLNLLAHLDRFFRDRAVLFICTYRPVEAMEMGSNAHSSAMCLPS